MAIYSGFGGLAEYGCFEANQCVLVPKSMSSEHAAAFLVAYGTSHIALERRAKLKRDEKLLVLGASGGVGLTAVELGQTYGCRSDRLRKRKGKIRDLQKDGSRPSN